MLHCPQSTRCLQLGGFGTSVEGEFQTVCRVIEDCHKAIHAMGVARIVVSGRCLTLWFDSLPTCHGILQTDLRIGTRTDKDISSGGNQAKVDRVYGILAKDQK